MGANPCKHVEDFSVLEDRGMLRARVIETREARGSSDLPLIGDHIQRAH